MCSADFCVCLLQILQIISESKLSEVVHFQNIPKKPLSGESSGSKLFSPVWAVIFVTSTYAWPDVRTFLTSGNGCFQNPSFPNHVAKKRRALGTRMNATSKPVPATFDSVFLPTCLNAQNGCKKSKAYKIDKPWLAGCLEDLDPWLRDNPQYFTFALKASFLGQLFIFLTISDSL